MMQIYANIGKYTLMSKNEVHECQGRGQSDESLPDVVVCCTLGFSSSLPMASLCFYFRLSVECVGCGVTKVSILKKIWWQSLVKSTLKSVKLQEHLESRFRASCLKTHTKNTCWRWEWWLQNSIKWHGGKCIKVELAQRWAPSYWL